MNAEQFSMKTIKTYRMKKIIKFRKEIYFGLGTDKYNPELKHNCIDSQCNTYWIKYDDYWYQTKLNRLSSELFLNKIEKRVYNRHQLEELIVSIIK